MDLGEHLRAEGEGAGEGAPAQLPVPVLLADRAVPASPIGGPVVVVVHVDYF